MDYCYKKQQKQDNDITFKKVTNILNDLFCLICYVINILANLVIDSIIQINYNDLIQKEIIHILREFLFIL